MSHTEVIFEKDPGASKPYSINWQTWLAEHDDDAILVSAWEAEEGIALSLGTHADGITTVKISGGEVDHTYEVTNSIHTTAGYDEVRTFGIHVKIDTNLVVA